ncbi:hypothetical protein ON010_g8734 [Phytophthora cinnamomi]|nr:hypothetical protein ON010_g8734 [Phytophthora cinnamomi]
MQEVLQLDDTLRDGALHVRLDVSHALDQVPHGLTHGEEAFLTPPHRLVRVQASATADVLHIAAQAQAPDLDRVAHLLRGEVGVVDVGQIRQEGRNAQQLLLVQERVAEVLGQFSDRRVVHFVAPLEEAAAVFVSSVHGGAPLRVQLPVHVVEDAEIEEVLHVLVDVAAHVAHRHSGDQVARETIFADQVSVVDGLAPGPGAAVGIGDLLAAVNRDQDSVHLVDHRGRRAVELGAVGLQHELGILAFVLRHHLLDLPQLQQRLAAIEADGERLLLVLERSRELVQSVHLVLAVERVDQVLDVQLLGRPASERNLGVALILEAQGARHAAWLACQPVTAPHFYMTTMVVASMLTYANIEQHPASDSDDLRATLPLQRHRFGISSCWAAWPNLVFMSRMALKPYHKTEEIGGVGKSPPRPITMTIRPTWNYSVCYDIY